MIFSEKLIDIMKCQPNEYYSVNRIANILGLTSYAEKKEIENALTLLEDNGHIFKNKNGKYILFENSGLIKGVLSGNAKGFAFLIPDNREEKDYFIPRKNLNGALHGDKVIISVDEYEPSGDVGIVMKILERGFDKIVGRYQRGNNNGFVIPDDKRFFADIYIPKGKYLNARNGDKVVVKINKYRIDKNPEGEITEILGGMGDKWSELLSIIRTHNIYDSFTKESIREVKSIPQQVTKEEINNRRDFRNDIVFTIDGDDSKDFDDAISIKKNGDNYILGVHIADVSHYVKENSAIDKDGLKKGNSVYFIDKVVPMLPFELSNGICSLNEGVDRLTLSCIMTINNKGEVVDNEICESVINSKHRMTYDNVTRIIEGDKELLTKYDDIYSDILLINELANILIKKREIEGVISFDTAESKILLNEKGFPIDVLPLDRGISNRIIEEFMILANTTVAEKLSLLELPCIYRVHQKPTMEKLKGFLDFVNAIGINFKLPQNNIYCKNFSKLLYSLKNNVLYLIVNRVLLRSMQKAKYSSLCDGHFGLSLDYYCHFTSPIRRYSDLFTHRMVKKMLKGEFDDISIENYDILAEEIALQCSESEIKVDEAERDYEDLKKTQFMSSLLGEEFEGVISGITAFGVFVELPNTCEGLVRIENIQGGLFNYNEKMYTLSDGNISYTLGEKVKIKVVSADVSARKVGFVFVD